MTTDSEKLKLHFAYCSLILVLIIIAVATDRWTTQQKFTEYLSNAATMTSLVLGLVAIFYSFIANDGLSRSLGNINMVADTISKTRDQITNYLGLTAAATDAANLSTARMQELSHSVNRDLTTLNETLTLIKEQSVALHGSVSALPGRLDKLETSVLDATRAVGEKLQVPAASVSPQPIDASVVKRFLELAPVTGNLLAVACVLAARTEKTLTISEFTVAIEEKIDAYMSGFLAATFAAQLIKRDLVPGATRQYLIKSVHPALESTSRSYFVEYVERAYKDKPDVKASWLAKLGKVEALFQ